MYPVLAPFQAVHFTRDTDINWDCPGVIGRAAQNPRTGRNYKGRRTYADAPSPPDLH